MLAPLSPFGVYQNDLSGCDPFILDEEVAVPRHRVEVIDRTYAAILAAKTPAERVAMIADCHRSARLILAAGERMRHPELTEERIAESVSRRMLHGAI